jgi:fatty-acyl-CoA synthase
MPDWFEKIPVGELPAWAATRWAEREALVFAGRRWRFGELATAVDAAAKGFMALGIAPGERVGLWAVNSPTWMVAMFALAKIGAIFVPINSRLRTTDVAYILGQSESCAVLINARSGPVDYLAMVREMGADAAELPHLRHTVLLDEAAQPGTIGWPELHEQGRAISDAALAERAAAVDPDGLLYIMYTSGTTGFPKGAMHTHNVVRNVVDQCNRMAVTFNDVLLTNMPLFHVLAYFEGPLLSMVSGARQVLMEGFEPEESLDLIAQESVTMFHGFDFNFKALLAAQARKPRDMSSLRMGICGAGMASSTEVAYQANEVFMPTVSGFGMTEIGIGAALGTLTDTPEQRCETSGYPLPGYEFRIVDPATDAPLPAGTEGEIQLRGYMVTQGYYKKPEETERAFAPGRWLRTGDMGYLRPDGYVRLLGRYKDMIKVGGENVDPLEVENFLLSHPAVQQVAVVSAPDEKLTEVGVAFVVPEPGHTLTAADVDRFCRGKLAGFKIPRHLVLVESFPFTGSGKVQKFKLREQALAALGKG